MQGDMIEVHSFSALETGKHLLVLGAVHGDETCGAAGIRRVIGELQSGRLFLSRGKVTFVPVCNPEAYKKGMRFVDRNLNRRLVPYAEPALYEEKVGNVLCPLLEGCDMLLDLHSYHVGGAPFVYVTGEDNVENDFASTIGAKAMVSNWSAAHSASKQAAGIVDSVPVTPIDHVGTTEYAREFGGMAATLECGQHLDPEAPEVAYRAIHRALRKMGIVDVSEDDDPSLLPQSVVAPHYRLRSFCFAPQGGKFARAWKNFDFIQTGEVIAYDGSGTPIYASFDGYIVLPHFDAAVGHEWFALAEEVPAVTVLPSGTATGETMAEAV